MASASARGPVAHQRAIISLLEALVSEPNLLRNAAAVAAAVHEATHTAGVLTAREHLELGAALTLLDSRIGTVLLFASSKTALQLSAGSAFTALPVASREKMLGCLSTSWFFVSRKLFLTFKKLLASVAATYLDPETRTNPIWEQLGYPGGAPARGDEARASAASAGTPTGFSVDFREHMAPLPPASAGSARAAPIVLECDVLVVGSGAGGGVAAATLAAAGHRVLVLEKGPFVPPEEVSGCEAEGIGRQYEKGGLLVTSDGAMTLLAGSCLGGGTTVNWACCIPTPKPVREEWADPKGAHRLGAFTSDEFEESTYTVLSRIGASTKGVTHNPNNQALLAGCESLGYPCDATMQNFREPSLRQAGWCCFGEAYNNKQGGLATYLADAARAGAKFLDKARVTRVLFEGGGGARRAVGALAELEDGRRLEVQASKAVVLAAGALHTPCVLHASGLRNPHLGKHLWLHPVTGCLGVFPHTINLYNGAPMTTVSEVAAAGPKGDYYGAKLECPSAHLGLMAAAAPWKGRAQYTRLLQRVPRIAASIVLQRDGGGGSQGGAVAYAADGRTPTVDYTIGAADRASMLAALENSVRIMVAAGADSVDTLQSCCRPTLQCTPNMRDKELAPNFALER